MVVEPQDTFLKSATHSVDGLAHNPRVSNTRLVFVALHVRDFAASALFYREAFGVPFESGQPPQAHAEVSWKEGAYPSRTLPAESGGNVDAST